MAKCVERLNSTLIAATAAPGYYPDGDGLYLQVTDGGSKSWIFRYSIRGRTREMGLGSLSAFPLAAARKRAIEARQLKADGVDPLEHKRAQQAKERAAEAARVTFKEEAESYIATHCASWRNDKHGRQWRKTLERYVYPTIGDVPVLEVDTGMVVKILEPIWSTRTETAHRVRGRIERVLNRSASRGHRSGENPARWKGHLENILPARRRVAPIKHHPALPFAKVGDFMTDLRTREGLAPRALELLILTATRTTETIGARPEEFNLPAATWTIPGTRTKSGRPHRVPLPAAALELVRGLHLPANATWVFPGRDGKSLSNNALLALLDRMGHGDVTAHGFRSTFRTWASECTGFPEDVIEMALGHAIGDETIEAYKRGDLFEKRRKLMMAWAQYCSTPSAKSADVVPMKRRK